MRSSSDFRVKKCTEGASEVPTERIQIGCTKFNTRSLRVRRRARAPTILTNQCHSGRRKFHTAATPDRMPAPLRMGCRILGETGNKQQQIPSLTHTSAISSVCILNTHNHMLIYSAPYVSSRPVASPPFRATNRRREERVTEDGKAPAFSASS